MGDSTIVDDRVVSLVENRTFDELAAGDQASVTRTLSRRDLDLFAVLSGDFNPTHTDDAYAAGQAQALVGHSLWGAALVSGLLGSELPGAGTVYREQAFTFHNPVLLGDRLTVTVTVTEKQAQHAQVRFACEGINQHGELVFTGEALVVAPREKVSRPRSVPPAAHFHEHGARHRKLVAEAAALPPLTMAVVHPVDQLSLQGALAAAAADLARVLLVGPRARIEAAASAAGVSLEGIEIIDVPHSHAAAEAAVRLVHEGRAQLLMKGSLHTDELMAEVVKKIGGLRTERRISHAFIMDVPTYPKPLIITDAAINIQPSLEEKADIVQNAIDLARALGVEVPKVALLSAVETVTPKLPATMEAAALCKMAERGQITGGILDGPLAFDNAISRVAADTKGIVSVVSGDVDILVVPDLEAGNMLAKQLEYLADAASAGVVLGARVPIVLTSRADGVQSRLASCAIAVRMAAARLQPV